MGASVFGNELTERQYFVLERLRSVPFVELSYSTVDTAYEILCEQKWEEQNLSGTDNVNPFKGRIQLWGHPIAVDWAEPEVEVDEDTMSSVKILYVRNLMLSTTEETIEKEFNNIKQGRNSLT